MSSTTKICSGCGQAKPRTEFYIAHKATATRKAKLSGRCKNCEADRKQERYAGQPTPGKINRNRARHRAVADLIEAHQVEFDALYEKRLCEAADEAQALAQQQAAQEHYGDQPVRLRPGRRRQGEKPADRIDVARCPHCIRHHDRGHVCAVCGAAPGESLSDSRNEKRVTRNAQRITSLAPPRRVTTVDPAALAEFNTGTQRARGAGRR
jgi:hypothetical protein